MQLYSGQLYKLSRVLIASGYKASGAQEAECPDESGHEDFDPDRSGQRSSQVVQQISRATLQF